MSTTRIMLEEAEGAVKAAREAEQAALAQAATDKAAADRRAADATKAREDAEARFTELLSAEQAAIDARRARVFAPPVSSVGNGFDEACSTQTFEDPSEQLSKYERAAS